MKEPNYLEAIGNVSQVELMKIWGELVECFHEVNGFGDNAAEIYAYRLKKRDPLAENCGGTLSDEAAYASNRGAEIALVCLLNLFCETFECEVEIDGFGVEDWLAVSPGCWEHRSHIKVNRTQGS